MSIEMSERSCSCARFVIFQTEVETKHRNFAARRRYLTSKLNIYVWRNQKIPNINTGKWSTNFSASDEYKFVSTLIDHRKVRITSFAFEIEKIKSSRYKIQPKIHMLPKFGVSTIFRAWEKAHTLKPGVKSDLNVAVLWALCRDLRAARQGPLVGK